MSSEQILLLPLWYVVFLLAITCHEAAHAAVACAGGDRTAYHGGQVTLNPLPHMRREPFGTVVVPLLSFFLFGAQGQRWMIGWASAPYDPDWERRYPRRASLMAAAGPAANLLLALIGLAALKAGLLSGVFSPSPAPEFDRLVTAVSGQASIWEGLGRFSSVLFSLNLLLCILNLIPLPPLDGASIVSGLSRPARSALDWLRETRFGGLIGLVLAWQLLPLLFGPLYAAIVLGWLYP